jgi:hypothetical protein
MKPEVRILVTCLKPELYPASEMVFKTLRTGFPTANVVAYINMIGMFEQEMWRDRIIKTAKDAGCIIDTSRATIHHAWVAGEARINHPLFILDTDVVFWDSFEQFAFHGCALAGRFIPRFMDSFTKCVTEPRLHTSLLYMDPCLIKQKIAEYLAGMPNTQFNPHIDFFDPVVVPTQEGPSKFYDTSALLFHAIGGIPFSEQHLNTYDHLNFGTLSDLVAPSYPEMRLRETHFAAFENPELIRGAWRDQDKFYADRAV